ncbi:MAG: hypothetical protein MUE73_20310 [Planctomycetes bacterium]|nr:hypothetical protein [Planctomycetota bacterium]
MIHTPVETAVSTLRDRQQTPDPPLSVELDGETRTWHCRDQRTPRLERRSGRPEDE